MSKTAMKSRKIQRNFIEKVSVLCYDKNK